MRSLIPFLWALMQQQFAYGTKQRDASGVLDLCFKYLESHICSVVGQWFPYDVSQIFMSIHCNYRLVITVFGAKKM